jgi:hypothetical protein
MGVQTSPGFEGNPFGADRLAVRVHIGFAGAHASSLDLGVRNELGQNGVAQRFLQLMMDLPNPLGYDFSDEIVIKGLCYMVMRSRSMSQPNAQIDIEPHALWRLALEVVHTDAHR